MVDMALIKYTLNLDEPQKHRFSVTMEFPDVKTQTFQLVMPVWIPGCYKIVDFARHVEGLYATDSNGETLPSVKVAKNRWLISNCNGYVKVSYKVYAHLLADNASYLDNEWGIANGPSVFMYAEPFRNCPIEVEVRVPESWNQVSTGLEPLQGPRHCFLAMDYDNLADCPILMGNHQVLPFTVYNVPHYIAIQGNGNQDYAQLTRDLQKIVKANIELWGDIPYRQYFFILVLTNKIEALEHKNSCYCLLNRWSFRPQDTYRETVSILAHEHFHVWNVTRLRPCELQKVDWERENYVDKLWLSEGFSNYYHDRVMLAAGLMDLNGYMKSIAKQIQRYKGLPGRFVTSPREASFDTWIKYYQHDEITDNTTVSYYLTGSLIALMVDLKIVRVTNGRGSLINVLRRLYNATYCAHGGGFCDDDLFRAVSSVAGREVAEYLMRLVQYKGELDIASALEWAGLKISTNENQSDTQQGDLGMRIKSDQGKAIILRVFDNGPAQKGNLAVGDEIIAMNGFRLGFDSFEKRLHEQTPGTTVQLLIARNEMIKTITVTVGTLPPADYALIQSANPTEKQKKIFEVWSSQNWSSESIDAPSETPDAELREMAQSAPLSTVSMEW